MSSSDILSVLRRLIDVWVDFVAGGRSDWANTVFGVINLMFTEFRRVLLAERLAEEGLPPNPPIK